MCGPCVFLWRAEARTQGRSLELLGGGRMSDEKNMHDCAICDLRPMILLLFLEYLILVPT